MINLLLLLSILDIIFGGFLIRRGDKKWGIIVTSIGIIVFVVVAVISVAEWINNWIDIDWIRLVWR
ncbi:MAG: hypothetical protein J7K95_05345 [Thermoplasmata archaeon]|nr:hypothetical protein [Thermoplasmata archaeon]